MLYAKAPGIPLYPFSGVVLSIIRKDNFKFFLVAMVGPHKINIMI